MGALAGSITTQGIGGGRVVVHSRRGGGTGTGAPFSGTVSHPGAGGGSGDISLTGDTSAAPFDFQPLGRGPAPASEGGGLGDTLLDLFSGQGATPGEAFLGTIATTAGSAIGQSFLLRERSRMRRQNLAFQQRVANIQARDIQLRGQRALLEHTRRTSGVLGAQRASLAAQGVDVGSEGALRVLEETAVLAAEDRAQIQSNIFREAFGVRAQAAALGTERAFERVRARGQQFDTIAAGGAQIIRKGQKLALERSGA